MKYFSLCFLLLIFKLYSAPLQEADVLRSASQHYPLVLEALENIETARMQVREAYGSFDLKLKSKVDSRTRGFYTGRATDTVIEKPFSKLNAKAYTGYRVSRGRYPDYEGKADTLEGGEVRAGVSFSLLRDRALDSRRVKLFNNQLKLSQQEAKALLTRLKTQKEAQKSYWNWVAQGNTFLVYKNLLEVAQKRDHGLRARVRQGDLARIYLTENQQYILKRKTQMLKAQQAFWEASLTLSLFLRDEKGMPILPDQSQLLKQISKPDKLKSQKLDESLKLVQEMSPILKNLSLDIQQTENQIALGQNALKPRLDLSFEMSKDQGNGLGKLEGTENRALLSFEIPLQRNLGQGQRLSAKARKRALEFQKQLAQETLQTHLKNLFYSLNTTTDVIVNSSQEVRLAEKLQRAENQKFNRGASDFFVVNLREQNTAQAKVENIKANLNYHKALAEYQAATLELLY